MPTFERRDAASGVFFIAVGLLYGSLALESLDIGQARNMGPGYFPVTLSGIIIFLGLAIIVRSFFHVPGEKFGIVPWRAIVVIALAIVLFAAFLETLGMLPMVFISAFVACMASSEISYLRAVLIAAVLAILTTLIFRIGVGLPIPTFGPLFTS